MSEGENTQEEVTTRTEAEEAAAQPLEVVQDYAPTAVTDTAVAEVEKSEPPQEEKKEVDEEIKRGPQEKQESSSKLPQKPLQEDDEAEFPLADSTVLAELKDGELRARKATAAIEVLRKELAEYMKDEMTKDVIHQKQKELMEKMQEFEDITKNIQKLVGLVEVASSQLGPPEKQLFPAVEGVRTVQHGLPQSLPEDTLPKVIICGTADVDQVPKIIVCEAANSKYGKPLKDRQDRGTKAVLKTTVNDSSEKYAQQGHFPYQPNSQGYPVGNLYQREMPLFVGNPGMAQPWMGMPQHGIAVSGNTLADMGQPGVMIPGVYHPVMIPPGLGQPGSLQPMGLPMPCSPCVHSYSKKHKSCKTKEEETRIFQTPQHSKLEDQRYKSQTQNNKIQRKQKVCYCKTLNQSS